ncbi:cytochrome P450 [Mycobacterium sp. E2479]|uniref:cytochrome P450 n=1 Tax=Mycobacterium sp. E2479 TaxID=1834134 RepID=UPI000800606E|nr:cytochrome P450 [Mycobacterium sp. E2479]OBH49251.1 cytochrome [Mycobacterium sp. E2479]
MATTIPDVDLTDGTFYASSQARDVYRWMRHYQPIFRDRNGMAALSTHAAILDAQRQPALFSSAGGMRPDYPPMPFMIDMDDPEHLRRRKLVNEGFTRKGVHARLPSIAKLCDTLIDSVCERGECDFVRDLAAPLPMIVIGEMLGVLPEEHDMLLRWSDNLMTVGSHLDAEGLQAMTDTFESFTAFCTDAIARRRSEPGADLISTLVRAEIDGYRLSDEEIVLETLLILLGGDETTRHTLSGGTAQLLRHLDQWTALRGDPTLLPGAVEEMLRWTTPAKNMCRTLTADTLFHGAELCEGEKVMMLYESANFDETIFGDPENFRIDRKPNNHITFGFGPHFCLGNQLARIEIITMMDRLLARLPDLRLTDDGDLPLRASNNVSGVEKMPVTFTPTRPAC